MSEIQLTNEAAWAKRLKSSQGKTREWFFRHAVELFEFQQACAEHKGVYAAKTKKWLGYSSDLASKWASAGSFIVRVKASFEADRLPASMSTLVEFSRMEGNEFEAIAKDHLRPDVTVAEVQEARIEFKRAQVNQKVEDEVLHFKYDNNVPDWIIRNIEDLAEELGVDNVPYSLTFKERYLCTRLKVTWGCKDLEAEPKASQPPPQKEVSQFEQDLITLGINLGKKKIERWALAGLLKSAKQMYHPDKLGNEEIFKTLPDIEQRLS